MNPRHLIRIEGLVIFGAATTAYYFLDGSLWLYLLLFFAPDLGMIGYLANPNVGSWTYNVVHTYVFPVGLFGIGTWQAMPLVMLVATIWMAHIGFDRALAYGLKFPTAFGDTHLNQNRFTGTNEPITEIAEEPQDDNPSLSR